MANVDAPFGLIPIKSQSGFNGGLLVPCYIPAAYGTSLRVGDPVVKTGTSNAAAFQSYGIGMLPTVAKATAGATNPISGVIVGFEPVNELSGNFNPVSTERVVLVDMDPRSVFEIQGDSDGVSDVGDQGNNADVVYTHAPTDGYGQSGAELDVSTIGTGATKQLKIVGFRRGTEVGVAHAVYHVIINLHTETQDQAGI